MATPTQFGIPFQISGGMNPRVRSILTQWDRLKAARSNFDDFFQDISELVLPRKSNITMFRTKGSEQTERLFDSTAIHSNQLLASSLQFTMTSPVVKWFQLKARDPELRDLDEVNEWLEKIRDKMFFEFQISNFESETHELYLDLGAFGTAAMIVEAKPFGPGGFDGFIFKTLDISEYLIAEDAAGRVDSVYRVIRMDIRQVADKFGLDKLGRNLKKKLESSPFEQTFVLHAVFPRKDLDPRNITNLSFPWASVFIALEDMNILGEGGFLEFPFMVPRWEKTSGERWGRSPGMIAMPDIRTLNKAIELELKAWAKNLDPPLEVLDDGVIGAVRTIPGAIIPVREMNSIKPLVSGARFDVSNIKEAQLKAAIEREFFVDLLQLPPAQGTPMTATEVDQRIEQMHRVLGPVTGRLKSEFLTPIIDRAFNIMLRSGAVPQPPDSVLLKLQEAPQRFDVEFLGPLAAAQKATAIVAQGRWLQSFIPLAQSDPSIMDNVDGDFIARNNGSLLGVPTGAIRKLEQVAQIRQARQQAVKEEQERQADADEASQAGDAAKLVKAAS